jgi:hypothetical protein
VYSLDPPADPLKVFPERFEHLLKPKDRERLAAFRAHSDEELEKLWGITPENVRQRRSRLRRKLAKLSQTAIKGVGTEDDMSADQVAEIKAEIRADGEKTRDELGRLIAGSWVAARAHEDEQAEMYTTDEGTDPNR